MFEIRIKSFFAKIWTKSDIKEDKLVVLTFGPGFWKNYKLYPVFLTKLPIEAKYRTLFMYVSMFPYLIKIWIKLVQ